MFHPASRYAIAFCLLLPFAAASAQAPEPTPGYAGCSLTLQAWALSNPELHCVCRSESQLPDCSGGGGAATATPALTTSQMIQLQIAGTLADAFVNMLMGNNAQAEARKKQMLYELQLKQARAAAQQQREEAMRLAAICQRLESTLKLSGTPALQLKMNDPGNGGLGLKLGDEYQNMPPVQSVTGASGPAQMPTNGPLALKLGEDPPAPATTAQVSQPSNASDLNAMTPRQLADLFASLPSEQQDRILQATQHRPPYQGSHTQNDAAPAPGTTETASPAHGASTPAAAGPSQNSTALGQLQQLARDSHDAANAQSPEDARALAARGFDTASGATDTTSVSATSSTALSPSPSVAGTVVDPISHAGNSAVLPVVDLSVLEAPPPNQRAAKPAPAPASANAPANQPADCIPPTAHRLPTREQLLTELAMRRTELQHLQQVIARLNRNIQSDQRLFDEWQAEAQAGYDRTLDRVLSLPTKLALDSLVEIKEQQFKQLKDTVVFDEATHGFQARGLTPAEQHQLALLERVGDLNTFDDFQKFVLDEKSNGEAFEEGFRQILSIVNKDPEVQSYFNAAEDLIDNLYDYVDLTNAWGIINTLDRNSGRYLLAVQKNGERMKAVVGRIRQIRQQLISLPDSTLLPYCEK